MALKINEYCIACGWCQSVCKNGAVREGSNMQYAIDPARCTECVGWYEEPRCIQICFLSAVELDPNHRETHDQLLEKWKRLHPGKDPAIV